MYQSLSSVAVHDGLLISADRGGRVHCLDAKTGKQYWVHNTKDDVMSDPLIVDGKVYIGTGEGEVRVLELSKAQRVIKVNAFDHAIAANPVFANGTLYVLTHTTLYAIAAKR